MHLLHKVRSRRADDGQRRGETARHFPSDRPGITLRAVGGFASFLTGRQSPADGQGSGPDGNSIRGLHRSVSCSCAGRRRTQSGLHSHYTNVRSPSTPRRPGRSIATPGRISEGLLTGLWETYSGCPSGVKGRVNSGLEARKAAGWDGGRLRGCRSGAEGLHRSQRRAI